MADGRRLRLPRLIWGLFALVSLVLGAHTAVLLGTSGNLSYTGAPQLQLLLPASPAGSGSASPGAAAAVAALDSAAGVPVLPALTEPGPFGPLPRIAASTELRYESAIPPESTVIRT